MSPTRKLSLHREELGELSTEQLRRVAAAYKVISVNADCGLSTGPTHECEGRTTCEIVAIAASRSGC